jgi:hypothetical protein
VPLGKKVGGHNRMQFPVTCQNCGGTFTVPKNRLGIARACSRTCLGSLQSRERKGKFRMEAANPMYKDGRSPKTYRRNLKNACERCESVVNLLIHHRDENRHNNDPTNLETLCKRCHQLHHECWRNLPNGSDS